MLNKNFLKGLLAAPSPSGYEDNATAIFNGYCHEFAECEYGDSIGNSAFSVGKGDIRIMLSGHIDQIGMQVQNIDDDGFIHFIKIGGIDPKTLLGATVTILSSSGQFVKGVIGKKPIHIEWRSDDEKNKVTAIKDMKIDCGFESKKDALEVISIGDPIIFESNTIDLSQNRISAVGLDDKIGVFVVAEVLKELSTKTLNHVKVYGCACTQEEVGAHGASIASKNINPNYSIDYDVTFATDDGYVSANEWGDIKLGKGGCIAHGTDSNAKLVRVIKDVCVSNKIPFQEFSVGSGGTDTIHIKRSANDCLTALLSIPNRNMHTQVEVIDYRDIQSLVDMTVETILKIDAMY